MLSVPQLPCSSGIVPVGPALEFAEPRGRGAVAFELAA